jgi:hypothetical protein
MENNGMNWIEDFLVRLLVAETLGAGGLRCRACSEVLVVEVEGLLQHYDAHHRPLVIGGLVAAVLVLGAGAKSFVYLRRNT